MRFNKLSIYPSAGEEKSSDVLEYYIVTIIIKEAINMVTRRLKKTNFNIMQDVWKVIDHKYKVVKNSKKVALSDSVHNKAHLRVSRSDV
jgi:hypothetical protein